MPSPQKPMEERDVSALASQAVLQPPEDLLRRLRPDIEKSGGEAPPDPEMEGLDPIPNAARPADVRVVQNDGFGFGGNNAIVLLRRL